MAWKKVASILKSKDNETGEVIPGRFYMKIIKDVSFNKNDTLNLFQVDSESQREYLQGKQKDNPKITNEFIDDIVERTAFDVSVRVDD